MKKLITGFIALTLVLAPYNGEAARDFNGTSSDYIDVTLTTAQQGLSTITYSMWIYFDSVAQYRTVFRRLDSSAQDFRIEFDDGWGMALIIPWSGAPGYGAWSVAKPSTGGWHHLFVSYDYGSTTNDPVIKVDNVSSSFIERQAPSGSPTNDATTLRLGGNIGLDQMLDGRLAEVAVWNRVLTTDEATMLSKGFAPTFIRRGLVQYSPIVGKTETELANRATVTVNGTAAIAHPRIYYPK